MKTGSREEEGDGVEEGERGQDKRQRVGKERERGRTEAGAGEG